MAQRERLSHALLAHLQSLTSDGHVTGESAESLAVAVQCLSESLGVDLANAEQTKALGVDRSLQEIFDAAYPPAAAKVASKAVSKEDEATANGLKDQGNDLMRQNKYEEAIGKYTAAIDLSANAIFYCNRAAAYSKVGRHSDAVEDSQNALKIDAKYSKAYARMGFAYLNMHKYEEAKDAYENALNIDPANQSYKDNLDAVKEKLTVGPVNPMAAFGAGMGAGAGAGGMTGMPGGMGGAGGMPDLSQIDFGQMMNNPAFMNMANQFMTDPNMQAAFGQMAEQFMGAGGPMGGGGAAPGQPPMDLGAMMQDPALLEMARSFEENNPDMINQLRQNFQPPGGPPSGDGTDPAI